RYVTLAWARVRTYSNNRNLRHQPYHLNRANVENNANLPETRPAWSPPRRRSWPWPREAATGCRAPVLRSINDNHAPTVRMGLHAADIDVWKASEVERLPTLP